MRPFEHRPSCPLTVNVKHSAMLVLYSIARDHQVSLGSAITTLVVLGAKLPPEKPIARYKIRAADPSDPFVSTSCRVTEAMWAAQLLMVPNQFSSMSAFIEWAADERAEYVFDYYQNPEVAEKMRAEIIDRANRVTLGFEGLPVAAPFFPLAPKRKDVKSRLTQGACPAHTGPECTICKGTGIAHLTLADWARAYGVRPPARS